MHGVSKGNLLAQQSLHRIVGLAARTTSPAAPEYERVGATASGLMPASKAIATEVSGIVRAWPDFICDAGTCHLSPSISPQVAGMTSPVLGQQVSKRNSSAAAAGPVCCRNSEKKAGRCRHGIASLGFTFADTRGRSLNTLAQGLGPLNRPGSTAMACSIVCSIRPKTRRAVSLVVSQAGLMTLTTSACVKLTVALSISAPASRSTDCCHSFRWPDVHWPRMWVRNVRISWRNVTALSGTAAPARTHLGSNPRSFASLSSARFARASASDIAGYFPMASSRWRPSNM